MYCKAPVSQLAQVTGETTDQLALPRDLVFDWKGNLLVADAGNNRVQRSDLFIDVKCGK